jgi:hypothetical protein
MSSIWTPGGERPVGRTEPDGDADDAGAPPFDEPTAEQLDQLKRQLAATPAAVVVANHAMGLFELAALHLSQEPPNLVEASVAIDAMGALVEGLAGRLGEAESTLTDALAQLRLAFVQVRASLPSEE